MRSLVRLALTLLWIGTDCPETGSEVWFDLDGAVSRVHRLADTTGLLSSVSRGQMLSGFVLQAGANGRVRTVLPTTTAADISMK